jgi:hypothetical protein
VRRIALVIVTLASCGHASRPTTEPASNRPIVGAAPTLDAPPALETDDTWFCMTHDARSFCGPDENSCEDRGASDATVHEYNEATACDAPASLWCASSRDEIDASASCWLTQEECVAQRELGACRLARNRPQ